MEVVAAILIFGTLIVGVVAGLAYLVHKVWQNLNAYNQTGGYKTHHNHRQYRAGKIPHKFTGEYREQ